MTGKQIKIVLVAGARPNFMKVAPIIRALEARRDRFDWKLVHTGQHYDEGMSTVFFKELGIPEPAFHMGAGGGTHAEQTARIMMAFERYLNEEQPDLVLVVGDVDSTLACSIVAKKFGCTVAHVEAGLRSRDRRMPEEINRLVTDAIADLFFVTEPSGMQNLAHEGQPADRLFFVGHVMIDNLFYQVRQLKRMDAQSFPTAKLKQSLPRYGVVTLHRPSNVDDKQTLAGIVGALGTISRELPLIFPVHPRTKSRMDSYGLVLTKEVHLTDPLPYMEFLNLWKDAAAVLTDSGGLQEETTALGVPCITLRSNTERPVTVTEGTNVLVGQNPERITEAVRCVLSTTHLRQTKPPQLWDGDAALRIVAAVDEFMSRTYCGL